MSSPIYVFVRHCGVSTNSINKQRPSWFSKKGVFQNLLETKDENTHIYVMLDTASTDNYADHFTFKYAHTHGVQVVPMMGGTDAHSFINMINYVCDMQSIIDQNAIIYLLEDDYIHRQGWCQAMREAFEKDIGDYVSLYDHPDKYTDKQLYGNLHGKISVTKTCHWRTTPSTTNTYAMRYRTLLFSKEDHVRFSCKIVGFTFDHAKFVFLNNIGKRLVSAIPAYSTHVETDMLSPTIDWEQIAKNNIM